MVEFPKLTSSTIAALHKAMEENPGVNDVRWEYLEQKNICVNKGEIIQLSRRANTIYYYDSLKTHR